jgi:LysM repeat protein
MRWFGSLALGLLKLFWSYQMKASNPFQIPSCFAELQVRRQKRFKKTVVAVVVAASATLVILLIAGCMSQKSEASAGNKAAMELMPSKPAAPKIAAVEPKPATVLQRTSVAPQPVAPAPVKTAAPPAISKPATFYVVKPGDTLTRIAKLHGLTVKTLMAVNGLESDAIVAGAKLKLPSA